MAGGASANVATDAMTLLAASKQKLKDGDTEVTAVAGKGLHSFTSQLNLSAFYGIGGARRGRVARVEGVLGGVYGV
jgi:hypothetical protein